MAALLESDGYQQLELALAGTEAQGLLDMIMSITRQMTVMPALSQSDPAK